MPFKYLSESAFLRNTEDAPNSSRRFFRMGYFSWFNKPEGEGCFEKFFAINYYTFWGTMPYTMLYCLAFKKIRNPMGIAYYYTKFVWPFHAAASTFAVASCGLAGYRGKDDGWNWGIAASLAGAMPGLAIRNHLIRIKAYGTGMWFWSVPTGMAVFGILFAFLKQNNPKLFLQLFINSDERFQFQPEKRLFQYEDATMPGERWKLDWFVGGKGKDMPFSWVGEKWESRQLLNKRDYGYLECELDQVPEIEKAIRNRS